MLADLAGPVRIPLFAAAIDPTGFAIMAPPGHPATHLLPGARVAMLGPLGKGFRIENQQRLLVITEAGRLPPLLPLLTSTATTTLVVEAATRARLPSLHRIPPTVELHTITHDGSAGHTGTLEQLLDADSPVRESLRWADCACFSCEPARYPALARSVRRARMHPSADFAQALIEVTMPCGAGACEVCRIQTRSGERRACSDGPVFDLLELDTDG